MAGIAATVSLAQRGFRVTLLESRTRLGGRASSFSDPASGQLVDACQHVTMGCCTSFAKLCETVGIGHLLAPQRALYFLTPDRRVSRFAADPWPAPFHLGRALASAHYLTAVEKLRVGYGLLALVRERPDADPPLGDWLRAHRQTPRTIARFWAVVLTSALNETVDRVGLKYARKVFADGFLGDRDGWRVSVPRVPLGRLYGAELRGWLARHGVEVRENAGVRRVECNPSPLPPPRSGEGETEWFCSPLRFGEGPGEGWSLHPLHTAPPPHPRCGDGEQIQVCLRDGSTVAADYCVLAVPFDRVADLLPPELAADPYFAGAAKLEPSPITSVHLWYDRPLTRLPHVVLVDCLGHWLFNRGEVAPGEYYVQVVVSASRQLRPLGRDEVQRRVVEELGRLFPVNATLLRAKVVTDPVATFSVVPGVDALRPPQVSPVRNMAVAGDWTDTGWPATMEGAVRSGFLAAEAIFVVSRRREPA